MNNKIIRYIRYIGHDSWSRATYQIINSNILLCDINCIEDYTELDKMYLHTLTINEIDEGEPDNPINLEKYELILIPNILCAYGSRKNHIDVNNYLDIRDITCIDENVIYLKNENNGEYYVNKNTVIGKMIEMTQNVVCFDK